MTKLQPDLADLQRRVRRLQRRGVARRAVIGVLVSGVLAAGIIAPLAVFRSISGDDGSQAGATGATPSESPSPELTTFADPEDGLSIQAPSDWQFDTNPVPNLIYPAIDFALGNWLFPSAAFGSTELPCPNEALRELPAEGIFIWIQDYEASDIGPQVAHLFDPTLEDAAFGDEPVQGGCANVPYYVLYFHEGQRAFVVSAAFGSSTGAEERDAALQMVHSIRVEEPGATFEPIEGWNIVLTTIDPNNTQDLPIVWAANVPFSPEESTSGFPNNTVRGLPPNGIVLTVIGPREYTGDTVFPPATFPLTISQGFCSHDQYETQPAPRVSKCLVDTMVGDQLLNVTVWFGMNTPSEEMYDEANAQLARLVVPGQP